MFFRAGLVRKVTGQEGSPSTTRLKASVSDFSVQRSSVLLVNPSLSRRHREGTCNQTTQSGIISVCVLCIRRGATRTSQRLMRVTCAAVIQITACVSARQQEQEERKSRSSEYCGTAEQSSWPSTTGLALARNQWGRSADTAHDRIRATPRTIKAASLGGWSEVEEEERDTTHVESRHALRRP